MNYPTGYDWLGRVGQLPKMVVEALSLYGIHEGPGSVNNPTLLSWAHETRLDAEGYSADSIPWCGLFMALVAQRAGYAFPKHPLWALNWRGFGTEEHQPVLGDVLVFLRPGGGHVGLYVGEDRGGPGGRPAAYHVLGGNTSDAVKIAPIDKHRLVAARAPAFKVGRPASAVPYVLGTSGALSKNEA